MGAGRSEAVVQLRRNSVSSSRSSSGYQSEVADELDGSVTTSSHVFRRDAGGESLVTEACLRKDLETVKDTAHLLALDITDYMLKPSSRLRCRHASTMRRLVNELSVRHEIIFASIARRLTTRVVTEGPSAQRWQQTFFAVVNELFSDGKYNWGRVATIYAFAGWLVKEQCQAPSAANKAIAEAIGSAVGDYVADNLSDWICQQGGWDALEQFFPSQNNYESMLWHGLLISFLAFGALALFALLR